MAAFYRTPRGKEPVREWLLELDEADLWEVRASISGGRIAVVIFRVRKGPMVLLHGFIKKTRKTPAKDRQTARNRMNELG